MQKLGWILLLIVFTSCEKDINFNLDESAPTLVVEAEIESNKAPRVVLTKSISYFSELTPEIYLNSFVRNAEVYISNGTFTHKLKEYAEPIFLGINTYYYSIDSSDLSTSFLGEFNKSYNLRILSEGKEYLSSTKIPSLDWYPDSVFFKPVPFNPDTNARSMFVHATEPGGLGNYCRYFTKKNSERFLPGPNSVFSDQVIDGTTYTVQVQPGIDRNADFNLDSIFFKKLDTVTLKFCNIDRTTYNFWNTWEFANQSVGNPFTQPGKVLGNISNGALGAFCGYAAWYRTEIVK